MKPMKPETVAIIGKVVSVIGVAATLVADWANKRNMDDTIKAEVARALREPRRSKTMRSVLHGLFSF